MKYKINSPLKRLIGLLSLGVILISLPFLIRSPYYLHLVIMACINIVLAMTFSLMFSAGLITLGAAAFWAIGAYASTVLVMNLGISFWLALPFAGMIAGIFAFAFGLIIVRTPGFIFVMETFVINMMVVHAFGHITQLGGWGGICGIPRPGAITIPFIYQITFATKIPYYYLILLILLMTVIVFYALHSSRIGTAWRSIKLNPGLAQTLGINLFRYRVMVFTIASAFAGLTGSFYAHYYETIEPETFIIFKSLYIQIYGILGGLNFYILGPTIGASIMTFAPEFLRITQEYEPIYTGSMLILLAIILPGGILSIPERISALSRQNKVKKVKQ